ncbi:MAG TPA: sigma-70 family RNA polymerase sigma factor [Bryobacteraceae bacterium]|nr:sigma-70 family RNA polymerase sigma factor [Bryobacteraceae bacterium]
MSNPLQICTGDQVGQTAEDRRALDERFSELYDKIRLLASRVRWPGTNPTLTPTALAHEAYMKLLKEPPDLSSKSYDEVIAIFANTMRQILIDGARRKNAQKRVPVNSPERMDLPAEEAITLDIALGELERENPVQARIVQCRFLLGMTVDETAAALAISKRTVEREWQEAKAHLGQKIHPGRE